MHKKQSGGSGQFADVAIRFEPAEVRRAALLFALQTAGLSAAHSAVLTACCAACAGPLGALLALAAVHPPSLCAELPLARLPAAGWRWL